MTYRKGERPVSKPLDRYTEAHPVAHMIETGDRWFHAWMSQKATPIGALAKQTGIPAARLLTIDEGGPVSCAELDALARAWSTTTTDLKRCIGDPALIVE